MQDTMQYIYVLIPDLGVKIAIVHTEVVVDTTHTTPWMIKQFSHITNLCAIYSYYFVVNDLQLRFQCN